MSAHPPTQTSRTKQAADRVCRGLLPLPSPGPHGRRRSAAAAAVQCSVDCKTDDWGSGFTAELTLTNRSATALDDWTLTYAYKGNQQLTNGWNGTWSQSGKTVRVTASDWNKTVAAGAAVTAGGQFGYSGTNSAPTSFAVNGTSCTGGHQPPVAVLTSPTAGAVCTAGTPVPLAATAAAADSATIGKVEFYSGTTLLGTDTTAPFTFDAAGLAAGSPSLYAKAYDSLGASAESAPVGITVAAGPALVATPAQLSVRRGETGTFDLKLSKQPAANVTVSVARASGNTDLAATPPELIFTPANWNTAQKVTVTAGTTGSGSAVFTATATVRSAPNPSRSATPPRRESRRPAVRPGGTVRIDPGGHRPGRAGDRLRRTAPHAL
ncbi:cellulose binding domain-containing protein, partial [Streptomyces sp. XY332]|uniref:cellulose binding domain-containing protein n=1 Tax=Streptomyces sp. XY332 TaxID=1415561 RepID=UPI000B0FC58F